MDIPHTPNPFNALQFHIHTYSEHEIQGQGNSGFFPAELHVVHQESTEESFAVFGTMIDVGDTPHPMFEWFLQGWEAAWQATEDECSAGQTLDEFQPLQKLVTCPAIGSTVIFDGDKPSFPINQAPNVYDLPTNKSFGTFTYKGGLTTPGCTEIVNWNLLDTPMLISQGQLSRLEALIMCYVSVEYDVVGNVRGCAHGTVADEAGSTSRPPQPLNGRVVTHRCRDGPAKVYTDVGEPMVADGEFVKPEQMEEPDNTREATCEKGLYVDCPIDPRSNPTISPNLKTISDTWANLEGYWVGAFRAYDARGQPLKEVFASADLGNTIPYPGNDVALFINRTVVETRFFEHTYQVYQPASESFCALPIPDFSGNTRGSGDCGVNGYVIGSDKVGVAGFEKDGRAKIVAATGIYEGSEFGETIPVDERTFYSVVGSNKYQQVETSTFSNDAMTQITGSGQYFIFSDVSPYSENPLAQSYSFVLEQVDETTFGTALNNAYNNANVLTTDRFDSIESGDCVHGGMCPSEIELAAVDPKIADSPFDVTPRVKPAMIVLFVFISVAVVAAAGYAYHRITINSQADRYKELFAKRVAETIKFKGKITAEALEDEFRRLDKDGDGELSKEELKSFMGDKMSSKDFEAMFMAMDIDHSGTVEFAEFCTFLTHIFAKMDLHMGKSDTRWSEASC